MASNEDELRDPQEMPPPELVDEDLRETQERPRATRDALKRDALRETSEHKVLTNISKTFQQY